MRPAGAVGRQMQQERTTPRGTGRSWSFATGAPLLSNSCANIAPGAASGSNVTRSSTTARTNTGSPGR
jgi:hypothetical protein